MRQDPLAYLTTELDNLRKQGLYRSLRILESEQKATSRFDGKQVVNLSSNNYLGLATHPKLVDAMVKAGSADPAKYMPELAKISYTGAGAIHDVTKQGWFGRFFNLVSPL